MNLGCSRSSNEFRCHIVDRIFTKQKELDHWFEAQDKKAPPPPYTSIDLRDSGFKVAPVDSNIFPAGFNNICPDDWNLAAQTFKRILTERNGGETPKRVLVFPENHTNNKFYFENLWALREILNLGGFEVILGHMNPELVPNLPQGATSVETANGRTIVLERAFRRGGLLATERVTLDKSDLVLLNNDFSNGVPPEFDGLGHTLTPNPSVGWHSRKKSEHLKHYEALATEFASILEIDPWLIIPRYSSVDNLNFETGEGLDRLAEETDKLIARLHKDYAERGIASEPFVYIKHNSGTYGRSIMNVKSGAEVLEMNRREKNKMNVSKGGVHVSSVVLMEGIPTNLKEDEETAEPVIYLAGSDAIGGFLRMNPNRDDRGNLNSPGAHFKTLCFQNLFRSPTGDNVILEKLYGALGRLSSLANGREMQ
jgi:glutamate--cysteine ligase